MADLRVEVTCPACGHVSVTAMPTDRCVVSYDCPGCLALLKPKLGSCCVFCSYGDKEPVQDDRLLAARLRIG